MRRKTAVMAGVITIVVTLGVQAGDSRLVGREVARDGALTSDTGTLDYRDQEWFVDGSEGSYQLMMGRYGHELQLPYEQGAKAEVLGFTVRDFMAPVVVSTAGEDLEFWHRDRYPLWAGSGERRNAAEDREVRRPDDARGFELDKDEVGKRIEDRATIRRGRFGVSDEVDEEEPAPTFGRPHARRGATAR